MHLGTANTMASMREKWWIAKLRAKVKKVIKKCNVCKVFSNKSYGVPLTSALPEYRTLPDPLEKRLARKKKESVMLLFSLVPAPEQSI